MTDLQRWKDAVRAAYPQYMPKQCTVGFSWEEGARYQIWSSMRKEAVPLGGVARTPGEAWKSAAERIGK